MKKIMFLAILIVLFGGNLSYLAQTYIINGRPATKWELFQIRTGIIAIVAPFPLNKVRIESIPRDKAKKIIDVNEDYKKGFESFLRLSKTGIVRLVPFKPCNVTIEDLKEDPRKRVTNCPNSFISGSGSFFSFRRKDYVDVAQSDIGIKDNIIFSTGLFSQGILVSLGNIPIESLTLTSLGIKFLADFIPATTANEADKQTEQFEGNLRIGNYVYAKGFYAIENQTFALRVVAYKGYPVQMKNSEKVNFRFDPFIVDKRVDIIVIFRIVKLEADGSIIIIWKQLAIKDSPKIVQSEK